MVAIESSCWDSVAHQGGRAIDGCLEWVANNHDLIAKAALITSLFLIVTSGGIMVGLFAPHHFCAEGLAALTYGGHWITTSGKMFLLALQLLYGGVALGVTSGVMLAMTPGRGLHRDPPPEVIRQEGQS